MNPRNKARRGNQRGAATVEAIVAFSGFLFVIFTILNIINFCRVQTLISNAMDTVTKELTQYAYFYEITGLHKYDQSIQAIGAEGGANLNTVASSVGDLYNAFGTAADATEEEMTGLTNSLMEGSFSSDNVNDLMKTVEMNGVNIETAIQNMDAQLSGVVDNPVLYMKSIIAVAGSEGLETAKSRVLAAPLAKALLKKHFGGSEADETLKSLGVVDGLSGMNFNLSTIFTKEHPDEIHLVVYYKLNVSQLFDWADFEATLCKETRARAWLGGDAEVVRVTAASASTPSGGSPATPEETPPEEPPAESTPIEDTPTADTPTEDEPAGDRTMDEEMLAMGAGGLVILQNDYDELSADENLEALKAIVEYLNTKKKGATPEEEEILKEWAEEYGIDYESLGVEPRTNLNEEDERQRKIEELQAIVNSLKEDGPISAEDLEDIREMAEELGITVESLGIGEDDVENEEDIRQRKIKELQELVNSLKADGEISAEDMEDICEMAEELGVTLESLGIDEDGTSTLAQYGDDFGKMGTYVENPNIKVDWTQYAEHAAERMQQRGMTQEMVNNIIENGKVLSQNNGNKFAYITQEGVAIVSKEGKLITAWSSADFDSSMLEIISKLFGE